MVQPCAVPGDIRVALAAWDDAVKEYQPAGVADAGDQFAAPSTLADVGNDLAVLFARALDSHAT